MQVMKSMVVILGLIGAMLLAVVLISAWLSRRKRKIVDAGARIGLTALARGEHLIVPLVPLIERPDRKYHVILSGMINGYSGAFFDLFVSAGSHWNLQSVVLFKNPRIKMPGFQLRRPQWSQGYQRIRGDPVELPGRSHEMRRLKLTSDDSDWARNTFSRASAGFLEKVRQGRWTIEGLNHGLVVYRWGMRIRAGRLATYVQEAADMGAEIFALCGEVYELSD